MPFRNRWEGSEPDAKQLVSHEQHVVVRELALFVEATKGSVGASEVGEERSVVFPADAAVKPGDVTVFGKENVAALASDVDAVLGHGVRVARRVAPGENGHAADVSLRRASEPLDDVGAGRLRRQELEADDLLSDAEHVTRRKLDRRLGSELQVDAVERMFVFHEQLRATHRNSSVTPRPHTVALELIHY